MRFCWLASYSKCSFVIPLKVERWLDSNWSLLFCLRCVVKRPPSPFWKESFHTGEEERGGGKRRGVEEERSEKRERERGGLTGVKRRQKEDRKMKWNILTGTWMRNLHRHTKETSLSLYISLFPSLNLSLSLSTSCLFSRGKGQSFSVWGRDVPLREAWNHW